MPIIRILTVHLAGLSRQEMLQGAKTILHPVTASPPPNQPWRDHRGRLTKQVVAVLARFIDDDYRHRSIGRTGRCKPGIAHPRFPRAIAPGPAWLMHQV